VLLREWEEKGKKKRRGRPCLKNDNSLKYVALLAYLLTVTAT